jgi:hypothetical protein
VRAESEASVARLGPDEEEDEEEDELDGLRTHVAARAQNVDALEGAAKRRKVPPAAVGHGEGLWCLAHYVLELTAQRQGDVEELLHKLELHYKRHATEEVSHARAEVPQTPLSGKHERA